MPSNTYLNLLNLVSAYVDKAKAEEVIGRQLPKCAATPETLSVAGLKDIAQLVAGACGLYVADKGRRAELAERISRMASK
jgi:hypothetical protein